MKIVVECDDVTGDGVLDFLEGLQLDGEEDFLDFEVEEE